MIRWRKKQSNFDRLRAMSVDEMTEFIVTHMTCRACKDMHGGKCPKQPGKRETCREMIRAWLKQEAQE